LTSTTPVSSMLWVVSASFVGSFGAVLLKAGAVRLARNWGSLLLNWRLAAGAGVYTLSSLLFVRGIAQGELSLLYPLVALGYIWTMLWSRLFFGEPLTKTKFLALFVILAGVAMLGSAVTPAGH
jgi:drug/metabolite transporter (DMT)-like permease